MSVPFASVLFVCSSLLLSVRAFTHTSHRQHPHTLITRFAETPPTPAPAALAGQGVHVARFSDESSAPAVGTPTPAPAALAGPGVHVARFGDESSAPAAPPPPHVNASPNSIAHDVPLDEEGYLKVARLESTPDMEVFAKRVLESLNLMVTQEAGFYGMVPFYSGERSMQSYFAMKQEFLAAAAHGGGWLGVLTSPGFHGLVSGVNAPLSEHGFEAIVQTGDRHAVSEYINRTVRSLGYHVIDFSRLTELAHYCIVEGASQSFAKLRSAIVSAVRSPDAWATSGDVADFGEVGFEQVVQINSQSEMAKFTRRLARHVGCQLNDGSEVLNQLPVILARQGDWTYSFFEKSVRTECQVSDVAYYGSMHDVVGRTGILQITLDDSSRYVYSAKHLQSAGVVPTRFSATDAKTASPENLKMSCPLKTDPDAKAMCGQQEAKLGVWGLQHNNPGCASRVEQAIADSHRRAFILAQQRQREWTAIIEDDVVPLHPAAFDKAFKNMWEKVPSWARVVRLSWCTFEQDVGAVRKKTFADAFPFRLVQEMTWYDVDKNVHQYYTGGCTTGYMVHKSILPELIDIFPCCCPVDCCMERQFFYAPTKPIAIQGKYRGQQVMINMDAWDSSLDSYNYTNFYQGGIFVQDNRKTRSERPEWNSVDKDL